MHSRVGSTTGPPAEKEYTSTAEYSGMLMYSTSSSSFSRTVLASASRAEAGSKKETGIRAMLLPVSGIVVRCGNATDLESFVTSLILELGYHIDDELVVKAVQDRLPRHLGFEERDIHT